MVTRFTKWVNLLSHPWLFNLVQVHSVDWHESDLIKQIKKVLQVSTDTFVLMHHNFINIQVFHLLQKQNINAEAKGGGGGG